MNQLKITSNRKNDKEFFFLNEQYTTFVETAENMTDNTGTMKRTDLTNVQTYFFFQS